MTSRVTFADPGSKKAAVSVTLTPAPGRHSPTCFNSHVMFYDAYETRYFNREIKRERERAPWRVNVAWVSTGPIWIGFCVLLWTRWDRKYPSSRPARTWCCENIVPRTMKIIVGNMILFRPSSIRFRNWIFDVSVWDIFPLQLYCVAVIFIFVVAVRLTIKIQRLKKKTENNAGFYFLKYRCPIVSWSAEFHAFTEHLKVQIKFRNLRISESTVLGHSKYESI